MERGIGAVKSVFVVISGKGGVGKSTVACQLAIGLAQKNLRVGLLDVDLCGPSIPRILGLENAQVDQCSTGWLPIIADITTNNLLVMSIGFLLPDKNSAVVWRGPKKTSMIDQLLGSVCWGSLDALIIDTPPGTSDEHLAVVEKVREFAQDRLKGCIMVTTPQVSFAASRHYVLTFIQRVALCDVRRQLSFCEKLQLPIVGLVENMSGVECPNCNEVVNLFSSGGGEALAAAKGVNFLGRLPLNPRVTALSDSADTFSAKSELSKYAVPLIATVAALCS
ncbi:unnamed protein product [Dibothriocephalus latus]|uniref:Cytosolic Fe-S cluster assembly factor NUBP2 homolog n=1 Tax=Dibothriocephalus latus TaxID=60516 RepID=A0A3P7L507_DIBLA|nr:unnamed protein product [Dibothriocephalus latus]